MDENYKVYIKTDNQNIVAVNSSAFLTDLTDWIEIDSGQGDKYHHAQGNYFPLPIITDSGIYRYKYVNGEVVEKTEAEIETEESNLPETEPSMEADILSLTLDHEYRIIMLELGGL
jgi:hypothetical protein